MTRGLAQSHLVVTERAGEELWLRDRFKGDADGQEGNSGKEVVRGVWSACEHLWSGGGGQQWRPRWPECGEACGESHPGR